MTSNYRTPLWWITLSLRIPFICVLFILGNILAPNDPYKHEILHDVWKGK